MTEVEEVTTMKSCVLLREHWRKGCGSDRGMATLTAELYTFSREKIGLLRVFGFVYT